MPTTTVGALVDDLFRRETGRIVARLVRRFGPARLQLAEELAQEALLRALDRWPWHGIPDNPAGWLHTVAQRLAIDALRRESTADRLLPEVGHDMVGAPQIDSPGHTLIEDDELRLLFLCADPGLTADMRVPLMLNVACSFSAAEIAHGLLRERAAVAQALVRAKRRLRDRVRLPELPGPTELATRIVPVIDALHLMFSEGYEASAGELLSRSEICREALRLADLLATHPSIGSPQAHALAALFCFQTARLPSRIDANGLLVPLASQNRLKWNRELIASGWRHLEAAGTGDRVTEHHLLAAIAAEHIRASDFASTDWPSLKSYYDLLIGVAPTPVHRLNRCVILAETDGPRAALQALDELVETSAGTAYHLFHATRAEFLRRLGDVTGAAAALEAALQTATAPAARRLYHRRLDIMELQSS